MNVRRLVIGLGGLACFFGLLVATTTPGGWFRLTGYPTAEPEWVKQVNHVLGFSGQTSTPTIAFIIALAGALVAVFAWAVRIPQDRDF